jgi:hypothetical protein
MLSRGAPGPGVSGSAFEQASAIDRDRLVADAVPVTGIISRVAIVLTMLGLQVVLMAQPSNAAYACDALASNLLGKYSATSTSVYGTRARIEYRNPDLCGSDTDGAGVSGVWQAVTADSVPSGDGYARNYAQVGYIQLGGAAPGTTSGIHIFSQWTRKCFAHRTCGANPTTNDLAATQYWPAPTGTHIYAEYLRASDDRIHLYAHGDQIDVMGFDVTGDWSTAWRSEYFGETHHDADDLPGTSTAKTAFDYIQYYNSSGALNFWGSLNNGNSGVPARYQREAYSPSVGGLGMRLWTQ